MPITKLIVGNWKMNGTAAELGEIAAIHKSILHPSRAMGGAPPKVKAVICPPVTLLCQGTDYVIDGHLEFGGQDCHAKSSGAHTGDVSAHMLKGAGATYVIVGHSERRTDHGETSAIVRAKAEAAIAAGLKAIICVGETETQRDAGQAQAVVIDQVLASMPVDCDATTMCIAYEPVWAIGTGKVPSTHDVDIMHGEIRAALQRGFGEELGAAIAILYGGSVNPKNAAELLSVENVDGALVGGASLKAETFLGIINSQL